MVSLTEKKKNIYWEAGSHGYVCEIAAAIEDAGRQLSFN